MGCNLLLTRSRRWVVFVVRTTVITVPPCFASVGLIAFFDATCFQCKPYLQSVFVNFYDKFAVGYVFSSPSILAHGVSCVPVLERCARHFCAPECLTSDVRTYVLLTQCTTLTSCLFVGDASSASEVSDGEESDVSDSNSSRDSSVYYCRHCYTNSKYTWQQLLPPLLHQQ